jgi:3-deoxy-D-manno-octulosonate 8-phosphate phosphatase KdsC-like HAD superfamily phosphatase
VTVTVLKVGQKMRQESYDENAYIVVLVKPEERSYLGDQVVDGRVVSKCVLRKGDIGVHLHSSG